MSYIIHGATGAQGAPILQRLKRAGRPVIGAIHRSSPPEGFQTVSIDNGSVDSLVTAYHGAEGIFIHLPQTAETVRIRYAHNIAKAIAIAQPKRVVISTSGVVVDEPSSPLQASPESSIAILIDEVSKTPVSMAVVAPRLYLENLLLPLVYSDVLSNGILRYPLRDDMPVSWSSHLDVAEVVEQLLTDPSITGIVGIGYLPGLTGTELADGFAQHLGKSVRYESMAPESFGKLLTPILGEAAASNVAGFYQMLQAPPTHSIKAKTSAQQLVGLTPRSVAQWLSGAVASVATP
ncbi:TPA: NmrA family NAD(P)-binding protein [Serratia marcescens]|nr:NmrA family NAD(P)-binding protein [Serratia marcescens]